MTQTADFIGLPWLIWAVGCLVVAAVFAVVWPGWRGPNVLTPTSRIRYVIVRWGHAGVWVLLAASCLLRTSERPVVAGLADDVAFAALLLYVGFLAAAVASPACRSTGTSSR